MQIRNRLLYVGHAAAQITPFQPRGNGNVSLKVFATDLRLSRNSSIVAREPRVAVWPVLLFSNVLLMASSEARFCSGITHANV